MSLVLLKRLCKWIKLLWIDHITCLYSSFPQVGMRMVSTFCEGEWGEWRSGTDHNEPFMCLWKYSYLRVWEHLRNSWAQAIIMLLNRTEKHVNRLTVRMYSNCPSYSGGLGRRITWAQEFEISLSNIAKPCLQTNLSQPCPHSCPCPCPQTCPFPLFGYV